MLSDIKAIAMGNMAADLHSTRDSTKIPFDFTEGPSEGRVDTQMSSDTESPNKKGDQPNGTIHIDTEAFSEQESYVESDLQSSQITA